MKTMIDGTKNDIRVLCTGPNDSPDAGYVEGVPIDPPDDSPGWQLVDLWVEHDTVQVQEKGEKGEKGSTTTRKVNPAYYQLWVRPKTKLKVKKLATKPGTEAKPPTEPKKRGRRPKNDKSEDSPESKPENSESGEPTRPIDHAS